MPDWNQIARDVAADPARHQVLRERPDALVARVRLSDAGSVVVKLWKRSGYRSLLRELTRTGNRHREKRTSDLLGPLPVRVPSVLASFRLPAPVAGFTDVLVAEDLGECTRGIIHLGDLARSGQDDAATAFEDEVIRITSVLVDAHVVDRDHHLNNIVVMEDGGLARLDFELARNRIPAALRPDRYGDMLGQLVCSHAFAVQPHSDRSTAFAQRLARELRPSRRARTVAAAVVKDGLESQRRARGIDTRWELRW